MARSGGISGVFGWMHRWLVRTEAILVAGVAQELVQRLIKAQGWPRWAQVLWIMGCTLGMLGGLVLVLRTFATKTVSSTHQAARKLPLPAPLLLMHAAALPGLFCIYAWGWHLWPPW